MKKSRRIAAATLLVVIFGLCLSIFLARDTLHYAFFFDGDRGDWELMQLRRQLTRDIAHGHPGGPDETARKSYLDIADAHPGTRAEVASLLLISQRWRTPPEAQVVFERLLGAAKNTDIDAWGRALAETRPSHRDDGLEPEWWRPLAAHLIERVRQQPEHPGAARLLCEVAVVLHPGSHEAGASTELREAANLIQQNYASNIDIANFCEVAGDLGASANWTQPFEPHVRYILEVNQDRFVRLSAHFALASIVRSHGASRQEETRQLYEKFLADFDGETPHRAQGIEQANRREAINVLRIMDRHGIGMPAPETHGLDLNGNPISLADYRGRVVLISFWATWCKPCLEAIPHEAALLELFGESDFAVFGVNADNDIEKAKSAVREHRMTWRSLRTRQEEASHAKNWTLSGYPTFYLLDKKGVIADSWSSLPPESELQDMIQKLIDFNDG